MVDDPCQFVGGGGDCFGGAQLGPHPAIELAQRRLAVLKGLGCQAEGKGDAVLDPSRSAPQHFATTNVIVRAQSIHELNAAALRNLEKSGPNSASMVCTCKTLTPGIVVRSTPRIR